LSDVISRDIVTAARSTRNAGTTTVLLSACRSGQRAYEWPAKDHGVFTHYLLEGLQGAAWSEDTLLFDDLATYAAQEVRQWSENNAGLSTPQEPWYEKFGDPVSILLASGESNTLTPENSSDTKIPIDEVLDSSEPDEVVVGCSTVISGLPIDTEQEEAQKFDFAEWKELKAYAESVDGFSMYDCDESAEWADAKLAFFEQHDFAKWKELKAYAESVDGFSMYDCDESAEWATKKMTE